MPNFFFFYSDTGLFIYPFSLTSHTATFLWSFLWNAGVVSGLAPGAGFLLEALVSDQKAEEGEKLLASAFNSVAVAGGC